ncbi:MAG: PhoX family phosphatase [Pseudomonadota bacterium]
MNKPVDFSSIELDDSENIPSNTSGNRPFRDVLAADMERRAIMKGSLAAAATSFFAPGFAQAQSFATQDLSTKEGPYGQNITFQPVTLADAAAGDGRMPLISPDYEYTVLNPWGDPIEPSGPAYVERGNTSSDQARQTGIGHDGMYYFPLKGDLEPKLRPVFVNRRGVLVTNHEFGRNSHVLGKDFPETLEDVRMSQHAHGVSVVHVALNDATDTWEVVEGDLGRRIHVNTPMEFSGPAADSPLLQTPAGNVPLGTVNNCGNGTTPWGTYLTCEENTNGYFGATNIEETWAPTAEQARFGYSEDGFGYGWHLFDARFDLSNPDYRNEEHRFGWMVEIDPYEPAKAPIKRTAMGRFKHEGSAYREADDGRIAFYMGDDQRFDYIYKYLSARPWADMIAEGISPLDEGTLYVAQFREGGSGEWLELSPNNPNITSYSTLEEILVHARNAADEAGATPMDRPEWTATAPDGTIYCTLTNNSQREEANAANPLVPNADGSIIRWKDDDVNNTSLQWEIFLVAQDTHGTEESFSDPDGLAVDNRGRVFIQTDGGQQDGLQDQMLVGNTFNGQVRRLFMGVNSDEITGFAYTPNRRTVFINIQHPGNGDPSETNFPLDDGVSIPRDSTVAIRRKDRKQVGV